MACTQASQFPFWDKLTDAQRALACKPGETVLLDRGSHRSAYNALALLDLKPHDKEQYIRISGCCR